MDDRNGIPKFDLAEQIMSEQRKNASERRKKPVRKAPLPVNKKKIEPVDCFVGPCPVLLEQEQVIADIVARDIDRLCRSR